MTALVQEPFPKGALVAVGALLAVTVAGTAAVRVSRLAAPQGVVAPPAAESVDLAFSDAADGSIRVRDARTGADVGRVAPDTGGFVRGVMRGLARERMMHHIGQAPPFRLSRDAGGRLWLQDPATGRVIDLEAFGTANRSAFAAFLTSGSARA